MSNEILRPLSLAEFQMQAPGWPKCHHCGKPAEIVCASPNWDASGLKITEAKHANNPAIFCCRSHTDATEWWYWMWLIPAEECDTQADITIRSWDMLTHLAKKTWGPPFIAWLLSAYDLSDHARRETR
jgi:hypothetical protein